MGESTSNVESVIINLPFFPGFYCSGLSETLDYAEERQGEYDAEKECSKEYYPDTFQPEELRIDASEYCEILMGAMDYRASHTAMASDYCAAFDNWAQENLGTPENAFQFESMDSPREYNFATDRVYVTCPLAVAESLLAGIDSDKLETVIKERFTSYDGFISHYSNRLSDWQAKPLIDWDHNEYGTLLVAAIVPHIDSESEFNHSLCESIYEYDYEYVDQHCNWAKYESKIKELRAEKLAEWIETDPESAAKYVAQCKETLDILPIALGELDSESRQQWEAQAGIIAERFYRCPFTIDMFENREQGA